jgi:hypothetical protein
VPLIAVYIGHATKNCALIFRSRFEASLHQYQSVEASRIKVQSEAFERAVGLVACCCTRPNKNIDVTKGAVLCTFPRAVAT